ncbi:MAG: glycosyltransferase family 4 protein [Candidatus Thorarchaeota archaeon]
MDINHRWYYIKKYLHKKKISHPWRKITIIAFFVERFSKNDIGGVKTYLRWIASRLIADERKVMIIALLSKKDDLREEVIDNIPVYRLNCGDFIDRIDEFNSLPESEKEFKARELFHENDIETTGLKLAEELALFIKERNIQVIHFHNSFFISPYALYFLKQKIELSRAPPFYFWVHSPSKSMTLPNGKVSDLYNALTSFQNLFKEIYAVSNSVHNSLLNFGINSKVKYLGVDPNFYQINNDSRKEMREKLGFSEHSFVVIYTGRIIEEKGLDLLPKIYKELIKRDHKNIITKFLLVGDGNYKDRLLQELEKENITNRFTFVSPVSQEDLVDYYSSADCFILPSRREALGLSLLEAMSCSLPCVVNDLPSVHEIIQHPQNGIIIPQNNITEYVRWISSLIINKQLRRTIADNARTTIEEKFNNQSHYKYFVFRLIK